MKLKPSILFGLIFISSSVSAGEIPKRLGQCVKTRILEIGPRLGWMGPEKKAPRLQHYNQGDYDSGIFVSYENGLGGVSYEVVPAVLNSRAGDKIILCLTSIPTNCPPGDDRGKEYSAVNLRTNQGWVLGDSQHMCGGA